MFQEGLSDFFNGQGGATAGSFIQAFTQRLTEPVALYALGLYIQDEVAVRPNLQTDNRVAC
jgi:hypothetical protein